MMTLEIADLLATRFLNFSMEDGTIDPIRIKAAIVRDELVGNLRIQYSIPSLPNANLTGVFQSGSLCRADSIGHANALIEVLAAKIMSGSEAIIYTHRDELFKFWSRELQL